MNKTYKARVEISLIVEMDVEAVHEDNAAAIAEDLAYEVVSNAERIGYFVSNHGIRCTEVEEADCV